MIGSVSAHRRANAFAEALEQQSDQDRTAERPDPSAGDTEHGAPRTEGQGKLLALANGLRELPVPELDPEVKTVQRAQLVAAMEALFAEGGAGAGGPHVPEQRSGRGAHRATRLGGLRPRSRWSKGLAAGGLTVGVATGAFSGAAAASSDALPGDSLYGLKRGMEDVKLGLADAADDRGELYLHQASTRLNEARRLMERGRSGDLDHESVGEIRRALSGMKHDASEGHRLLHEVYERDGSLDPIRTLNSFAAKHRGGWRELRDRLPVQLTDVRDQVSSVFDAIDDEVGPLKSLLPAQPGGGASENSTEGSGPSGPGRQSQRPEPSASDPSASRSESGSPGPYESRQEDQGLLGGAGDLLDPPSSDTPSSSGGGADGGGGVPEPDVTIPPLLPGLLPDLGLGGGQD